MLEKSDFYYWPKLENRSKISLGHIWAPKFNLLWISWVQPTCQSWKIKCTLVHSKCRAKNVQKILLLEGKIKKYLWNLQNMLKLVLWVLMMIFMKNLPISTVFYMKNNFWTKISQNGHCVPFNKLPWARAFFKDFGFDSRFGLSSTKVWSLLHHLAKNRAWTKTSTLVSGFSVRGFTNFISKIYLVYPIIKFKMLRFYL